MYTFNQCTYITYFHPKPEEHMGRGLVTCYMGSLLKIWERGRVRGGETSGVTDHKRRYTGTHRQQMEDECSLLYAITNRKGLNKENPITLKTSPTGPQRLCGYTEYNQMTKLIK